jgi:hypothetical protein
MKSLTLILAFLPLIVFSVLARFLPHGDIGIAGLAAAVVALIAIAASRPAWPPKILNTCSLILFNRVLSTAWGLAIFAVGVSRVAAAAINGHTTRRLPEILLGLVIPAAILLYMLKFSKSYPDRVTDHQPAVPGA